LKRLDSRFHGNDRKTNLRTFYDFIKIDELVKSQKVRCPVIPAKAGIQLSPLTLPLSPGDGGEGGGEGEE
jgi:hypothetical protein